MSELFVWEDKYLIGINELDSQHQGLFELGSRLRSVEIKDIQPIVMELYQYTREHFRSEEKFQQKINYPHSEAHQKTHDNIIETLNQIVSKGINSDTDLVKLEEFYNHWLTTHIMKHDQLYAEHAKKLKE